MPSPLFNGPQGGLMQMLFQLKGLRQSGLAAQKEGAQYDAAFAAAKAPFDQATNAWTQANNTYQQQLQPYNDWNQILGFKNDPSKKFVNADRPFNVVDPPYVVDLASNSRWYTMTEPQTGWYQGLSSLPTAPTAPLPGDPPKFNFNYTVTPAAERVNADKMAAILESSSRQPAQQQAPQQNEKSPDPLARLNQFMQGRFY